MATMIDENRYRWNEEERPKGLCPLDVEVLETPFYHDPTNRDVCMFSGALYLVDRSGRVISNKKGGHQGTEGRDRTCDSRLLSNLSRATIRLLVDGEKLKFPSAEHAYQYLSKVRRSTFPGKERGDLVKAFCVGGRLDRPHRKGVGFHAKLAVSSSQTKSEDVRSDQMHIFGTTVPRFVFDEDSRHYDFWRPILRSKFLGKGNKRCRDTLLATDSKYLCEFSRKGAQESEQTAATSSLVWNQYLPFKNAQKIARGYNLMGKFLMGIREEVRREIKRKGTRKRRKRTNGRSKRRKFGGGASSGTSSAGVDSTEPKQGGATHATGRHGRNEDGGAGV